MLGFFVPLNNRRFIMQTENSNYFTELSAINVSSHLEKKGNFSYLSWPYAVQQLRMFDETATWEIQRFNGLPYLSTDNGTFVEVAVTVKGVTLSQLHPVLDNKNRPLLAPDAFDINTSIQRCLVKAIALHGLGLNVYAGEDLPSVSEANQPALLKPVTKQLSVTVAGVELLTDKQLGYIKKLVAETGTDEVQLLGFFGFDSFDTIPKSQVNRVISTLETNRKAVA
jgi:hypothetical protein